VWGVGEHLSESSLFPGDFSQSSQKGLQHGENHVHFQPTAALGKVTRKKAAFRKIPGVGEGFQRSNHRQNIDFV
jgi:hypothetical protein